MSHYYEVEIADTNSGYESVSKDYIIDDHATDAARQALINRLYADAGDIEAMVDAYMKNDTTVIEYEEMAHQLHSTNLLKEVEYQKQDGSKGVAVMSPLNAKFTSEQQAKKQKSNNKPYLAIVKITLNERESHDRLVIWAKDEEEAYNRAIMESSFDWSNYDDEEEALAEIDHLDVGVVFDSVAGYLVENVLPLETVKVVSNNQPSFDAVLIGDIHWTGSSKDTPKRDLLKVFL